MRTAPSRVEETAPEQLRCLEVAGRIDLLRGLRDETGQFLSLMRKRLHLLTRKLALNVEGFLEVLRLHEALSKLKIRLKVSLRVLYRLFVEFASAIGEHVAGLGHNIVSLAGGFEETIISVASLVDALAGEVAYGRGNFEIERLISWKSPSFTILGSLRRGRAPSLFYVIQPLFAAVQHKLCSATKVSSQSAEH